MPLPHRAGLSSEVTPARLAARATYCVTWADRPKLQVFPCFRMRAWEHGSMERFCFCPAQGTGCSAPVTSAAAVLLWGSFRQWLDSFGCLAVSSGSGLLYLLQTGRATWWGSPQPPRTTIVAFMALHPQITNLHVSINGRFAWDRPRPSLASLLYSSPLIREKREPTHRRCQMALAPVSLHCSSVDRVPAPS